MKNKLYIEKPYDSIFKKCEKCMWNNSCIKGYVHCSRLNCPTNKSADKVGKRR